MTHIDHIKVAKRDGRLEPIDLEKIHKVLSWAAEGLNDISISQVELKAHIQFYDGIKTRDIHETIIKSAADLISEETPDYQYLAARLAIFHLRKIAYGQFEPPHLFEHVSRLTQDGRYDAHILADYSREEFEALNAYLDHDRDMNLAYAGVEQMAGKYLVQDRVAKTVFESPQFLYILIGMCLFAKYDAFYDKATRLDYIKRFYDAVSNFYISLPTPIMSGVRTPSRQFSSCVLIETDDSLDSINATTSAIVRYVSMRAGIGIGAGRIRALGSRIRGGEARHTGCIPFYKHFQTAVKCCSQGGVRGGAATLFYPIWHLEVENLLVLKNNRGVEDNRVRHMDYGVQINRLMYERLKNKGHITLFSPSDVPGLYEAFFADQDEFERLYVAYEADASIRQARVDAAALFSRLAQERAQTGRIYIHHVDHTNTHSPFDPKRAPIRQSNLCMEIALPTRPLNDVNDPNGEIALCTLSAINLGKIDKIEDMKEPCELIVRALDALLDYQDYPVPAAQNSSLTRRTLGVGVINYAYYLVKNGLGYTHKEARNLTHKTFEALQYYLLCASNKLADELGPCPAFADTTYAQGILPVDTYKEKLNEVCNEPLHLDWEGLRASITKVGLRNSTLSALMPSETSSQIANATNGIEPPRGLVSVKASKDGILKQVVPDIKAYGNAYELLWQLGDNAPYLTLVGIMQKFIDQAISANTNYDPKRFEDNKVPLRLIIKDMMLAYSLGIKTLYYHNTRDGSDDTQDDACLGGACKL